MKITDIQHILLNSNKDTDVSMQKADEKFFAANFDENDGLQVEKTGV